MQVSELCNADCVYPNGEVTYGSTGHTNELVTLSAMGMQGQLSALMGQYQGRMYPGTEITDNTALYSIMMTAAGM